MNTRITANAYTVNRLLVIGDQMTLIGAIFPIKEMQSLRAANDHRLNRHGRHEEVTVLGVATLFMLKLNDVIFHQQLVTIVRTKTRQHKGHQTRDAQEVYG